MMVHSVINLCQAFVPEGGRAFPDRTSVASQLEFHDLALGLAVGPRQVDCCTYGGLVLDCSVSERCNKTRASLVEPRVEVGRGFSPDHGMEGSSDLPSLHEERHLILDGGNGDRLRFRECVPVDGQQSGDGPGGSGRQPGSHSGALWLHQRIAATAVASDHRIRGWPPSHAFAVAGSRSGSRAIVLRRSRSQMIVP